MKKNLDWIIRNTIDLHLHIGPEIIPRKYIGVDALIKDQKNKIKGFALKNHFYPTTSLIKEVQNKKDPILIGSITLNNPVGGLNSESIYSAALISKNPIIVWFPTIDAKNFLLKSDYQIPVEWVGKNFKARKSKDINGISIIKNKNLSKKALNVLKVIKKSKAILATGHLSWQEAELLALTALSLEVKKIIITHPIYQKIDMPVESQIKLVNKGCFIEICYSMYAIDRIPITKIVGQINKVGYKNIIITSDVGQKFMPSPAKALGLFAELLIRNGVTEKMLYTMMVKNPQKIISKLLG